MQRGVQADLFCPARRTVHDGIFRIGFVGRLSPEKNVRFLAKLETALSESGARDFLIVVVGDGKERAWLEWNLRDGTFTGVLRNEALAEAYANLDLFVFPSTTDTFGNVVLEALASGVPAVVMDKGGPQYLIDHDVTGFIARDEHEFIRFVLRHMTSPE